MIQTPAMALAPKALSPFPDLLIHNILPLLPTKAAVGMSFLSKQHQGEWSLVPFIDFVERREPHDDDDGDDDANRIHQHRKFINILKRYLEYREEQAKLKNDDDVDALHKLSIRMQSYSCGEDDDIVDKWLAFSFHKSVKKLHISLRIDKLDQILDHDRIKLYRCLSGATFANARSVTTLNLESVRMKNIDGTSTMLLPSLKALSLKDVQFDEKGLFSLTSQCPALEYLSLTSCSIEEGSMQNLKISSSSLKTLQIKHCKARMLLIYSAIHLESLTFFSSEFGVSTLDVHVYDAYNLKHVCIRAHHLQFLFLFGCHQNVKAVLNTPNLKMLFTYGYLKSKFYVEAPNLRWVEIIFWDLWSGEVPTTFNGRCKGFIAMRKFLQQFGCAQDLTMYVRNEKALIFPEKLSRNAFSSPIMPKLETVRLLMSNPPLDERDTSTHLFNLFRGPPPQVTEEIETSDLSKSLFWLAASPTKITTEKYGHGN